MNLNNETQVATLRSAALFAADKLRKAGDLLNRFCAFEPIRVQRDAVRAEESACRALADDCATEMSSGHAPLATGVLQAYADDLNRKAQLMSDRYNTEAATSYGDRLIEAYATLDVVRGHVPAAAGVEGVDAR